MKEYEIKVTEIRTITIKVLAYNEHDAIKKCPRDYDHGYIDPDYTDVTSVEFESDNYSSEFKVKNGLTVR